MTINQFSAARFLSWSRSDCVWISGVAHLRQWILQYIVHATYSCLLHHIERAAPHTIYHMDTERKHHVSYEREIQINHRKSLHFYSHSCITSTRPPPPPPPPQHLYYNLDCQHSHCIFWDFINFNVSFRTVINAIVITKSVRACNLRKGFFYLGKSQYTLCIYFIIKT